MKTMNKINEATLKNLRNIARSSLLLLASIGDLFLDPIRLTIGSDGGDDDGDEEDISSIARDISTRESSSSIHDENHGNRSSNYSREIEGSKGFQVSSEKRNHAKLRSSTKRVR